MNRKLIEKEAYNLLKQLSNRPDKCEIANNSLLGIAYLLEVQYSACQKCEYRYRCNSLNQLKPILDGIQIAKEKKRGM